MTSAAVPLGGEPIFASRGAFWLFWQRLKEDKVALAAAVVILLLIAVAIGGGPLATAITGHGDNTAYSLYTTGQKNGLPYMLNEFGSPNGPNSQFWFGADGYGHDLFVRTMYGTRTSLIVGVVASGIALLIGLLVGLSAGYFRGLLDTALSRFGDVMLALPSLLISIGIVAACSVSLAGCLDGVIQPGLRLVIIVIVLFTWPYAARLVRSFTLAVREKDFVEASRSLGASNLRIIFREILPNIVGPLIVYATLLVPQSILFESSLSYLGLGVPQSTASWGGLLDQATMYYDTAWWLILFPGLFLVLTTLAFNLLGDGLRDALDVRSDR